MYPLLPWLGLQWSLPCLFLCCSWLLRLPLYTLPVLCFCCSHSTVVNCTCPFLPHVHCVDSVCRNPVSSLVFPLSQNFVACTGPHLLDLLPLCVYVDSFTAVQYSAKSMIVRCIASRWYKALRSDWLSREVKWNDRQQSITARLVAPLATGEYSSIYWS